MADYSFESISAYDLEILVQDLLSEQFKVRFESFTTGRDGGIDLRYSKNLENTIIVQCKRYIKSRFPELEKVLRHEVEKIRNINPERYILVTTLGLTPANKRKITEILFPYIRDNSDIIDCCALNALIRQYPQIERIHYKLWLTSTEILQSICNSGLYNRSEIEMERIKTRNRLYVQNEGYFIAQKILDENHCCIISGEPGIGKTTLAEILCLRYITNNYSFICINSMQEAFSAIRREEKQIFLYDDFLGRTLLQDIGINDPDYEKFINFIENDSNRRLILTTREYIFKEAQTKSEYFARQSIQKLLLKQEHYSRIIKAKILYNHLYFSDVELKYLEEIQKDKKYLKIIDHKNYSPRIIEIMTMSKEIVSKIEKDYYEQFLKALNSPHRIWKIAFAEHISKSSRNILVLLGFCHDRVQLDDYTKLLSEWSSEESDTVEKTLEITRSIDELEGTFIKMEVCDVPIIQFFNPSIKDYVLEYIRSNVTIIKKYVSMQTFFWDQYLPLLKNIKKEKKYGELKLQCLNKMYENLDKPTLCVEITDNKRCKINFGILRSIDLLINETELLEIEEKHSLQMKISDYLTKNISKFSPSSFYFNDVISWYIEFNKPLLNSGLYNCLIGGIDDSYEYDDLLVIYNLLCELGDVKTEIKNAIYRKMIEMIKYYDSDKLYIFRQYDGYSFDELVKVLGKEEDEQIQNINTMIDEAECELCKKVALKKPAKHLNCHFPSMFRKFIISL